MKTQNEREQLSKELEQKHKELLEAYARVLHSGKEIEKDDLINCVFSACQFGNISALKLALGQLKSEAKSVLQLNCTYYNYENGDESYLDPLSIAISLNHLEICRYLILQHKIHKIEVTWNMFRYAANNDQIFSFLIEHSKLELNELTSLLHYMVGWGGSLAMIKKVFEAGANPCDPSEENSCLGVSIIHENMDAFKFFLELKPNINVCSERYSRDKSKITPFLLATMKKKWHFAKLLLDYKVTPVDINATQPGLLAPIHYFALGHSEEPQPEEDDIYLIRKKVDSPFPNQASLYKNFYVIFTEEKPLGGNGRIPVNYYNSEGIFAKKAIDYTAWKEFAKKIPCETIQEAKPLKNQLSHEILSAFWEFLELHKIVEKPRTPYSNNLEAILTLLAQGAVIEIPDSKDNTDFLKAKKTILFIKNRQEIFNQLLSLGMFGKSNYFTEGVKLITDYAVDENPGFVL